RPGGTPEERQAIDDASRQFVARYSPTSASEQLSVLSDLHDRGKLTDAEFAAEKAHVLDTHGQGAAAPTAAATAYLGGGGGARRGGGARPRGGAAATRAGSPRRWRSAARRSARGRAAPRPRPRPGVRRTRPARR